MSRLHRSDYTAAYISDEEREGANEEIARLMVHATDHADEFVEAVLSAYLDLGLDPNFRHVCSATAAALGYCGDRLPRSLDYWRESFDVGRSIRQVVEWLRLERAPRGQ